MSCRQRIRFIEELLRMASYLETPDLEHVIARLQDLAEQRKQEVSSEEQKA